MNLRKRRTLIGNVFMLSLTIVMLIGNLTAIIEQQNKQATCTSLKSYSIWKTIYNPEYNILKLSNVLV